MASEAIRVSPLHDLRGHLNTIRLNAHVLDFETDLTEAGHMALKRINDALERIEREFERMEGPSREDARAPLLHRIQNPEPD